MSGLLAANILRKQTPKVIESQKGPANNHGALLRFRTDSVASRTGLEFKKVHVKKEINYHGDHFHTPTIGMANEYCRKVTGGYSSRSIMNTEDCTRYIAPNDFLKKMEFGCNIEYNRPVNRNDIDSWDCPVISTIPMHNLMRILGWESSPQFEHKSIWSVSLDILSPSFDIYQTVYYPNRDLPFYRMSITGSKVIIEFLEEPQLKYFWKGEEIGLSNYILHFLENDFKIFDIIFSGPYIKFQEYGKLIPIDNRTRKKFILWATQTHNVYSLGRWATHRQILLDDVVNDVDVINKLINSNNYNR